jgi:tRNA-Thr(GGU) m(6)t(6)A37 methyltransferase TsaA
MLCDPERKVLRAYGVRGFLGVARRVSFLLDPEGIVHRVYAGVSPRDHAAEVLRDLKSLASDPRSSSVVLRRIGVVRSPFQTTEGVPRQAVRAEGTRGRIEIDPEWAEGLRDVEGFSHLLVIFKLHLVQEPRLTSHPPWDDGSYGVFATCSPYRPSPIGVSVVRLERREGTTLHIAGLDMADGSPVLDIKPYVPELYPREGVRIGWMTGKTSGMIDSRTGDR